ncbi:MAG: hypothetical protein M1169_10095 [Firmicutes bacterium]|nr:hypothetical protein [Bacillota bacterium]
MKRRVLEVFLAFTLMIGVFVSSTGCSRKPSSSSSPAGSSSKKISQSNPNSQTNSINQTNSSLPGNPPSLKNIPLPMFQICLGIIKMEKNPKNAVTKTQAKGLLPILKKYSRLETNQLKLSILFNRLLTPKQQQWIAQNMKKPVNFSHLPPPGPPGTDPFAEKALAYLLIKYPSLTLPAHPFLALPKRFPHKPFLFLDQILDLLPRMKSPGITPTKIQAKTMISAIALWKKSQKDLWRISVKASSLLTENQSSYIQKLLMKKFTPKELPSLKFTRRHPPTPESLFQDPITEKAIQILKKS